MKIIPGKKPSVAGTESSTLPKKAIRGCGCGQKISGKEGIGYNNCSHLTPTFVRLTIDNPEDSIP